MTILDLSRYRSSVEFLRLIVGTEGVNEFIELAVEHKIELVYGQADAMIGDAILFEIISADLFGAVAAADHRFSLAREGVMLFLLFELLQAGTEYAHRFFAVLY